MAQTFYPIDPVEVTPGTANAWTDVLGANFGVPAGATGVILHCVINDLYGDVYGFGLRNNGSTDNRTFGPSHAVHYWAAIGVDVNRIFEAYVGHITNIDIYLVGYTMSGVTFFTNAYNKSLPSVPDPNVFQDIDCHVEAPSAIGLIWEIYNAPSYYAFGMRKNGSADSRINVMISHSIFGCIIGCDASQICEGYIGSTDVDFFLVGYITDGCTFNTNATDVSLGITAQWLDLTALPANSVMGFIEVISSDDKDWNYGLRKNGSAEAIYYLSSAHPWAFVECDASYIIEGKISHVAVDFFIVGYATAVAASPVTIGKTAHMAAKMIAAGVM